MLTFCTTRHFFFLAVQHFWFPAVWRSVLKLFQRSPLQSRVRQQGTGTRCTVFSEKQDRCMESQSLLFIFPFSFSPSPFAVTFHVTLINTWPKALQPQPPQSLGTSIYLSFFFCGALQLLHGWQMMYWTRSSLCTKQSIFLHFPTLSSQCEVGWVTT